MGARKIVNRRIEELRENCGLSQKEFAAKLGLDEKKGRSTVNNWEGANIQVKSDDLISIAKTFCVSADWLLGLTEEQTVNTDLRAVAEYTGLTSEDVEFLHYLSKKSIWINMLSRLLQQERDENILALLIEFDNLIEDLKKSIALMKEYNADFESTEKKRLSEILSGLQEKYEASESVAAATRIRSEIDTIRNSRIGEVDYSVLLEAYQQVRFCNWELSGRWTEIIDKMFPHKNLLKEWEKEHEKFLSLYHEEGDK